MESPGTPGLPQVPRPAAASPAPADPGPARAASGESARLRGPEAGSAPPTLPTPGPARAAFGDRTGLAWLVARNALLTVLTLGFYQFWARTAIRRFYWANVAVAGERLEYTGTGAELFVGFLVATTLLAPLLGGFAVLRLLGDPESVWSIVINVVYGATIYVFIAAALFRARRYRLSRTRWRGIRFVQDGSTWRYIGLTLAWSALTALTLGVGFPWLRWAQQRYLMRCTSFGDRRFAFDGGPRALVWRWLLVLGFVALPFALAGAEFLAAAELLWDLDAEEPDGEATDPDAWARLAGAGVRLGFVVLAAMLGGGLAFLNYRIAEFRAFAAATRLGEVSVRSAARVGPVIGAALKGLGWAVAAILVIVTLGATAPAIQETSQAAAIAAGVGAGVSIVAFLFVGVPLIVELAVRFAILRHVVTTLELENVAALDDIAQTAAAAPRVGEGLADAFDLGPM